MKRYRIAGLVFVFTALVTIGIAFLTCSNLPLSRESGKVVGMVIFLFGVSFFTWTVIYLRAAFQGAVAPVSDRLITTGPYQWVRHPLYLSMIIIQLGIGIALRSLWGIVSIFLLFLPTVLYRAILEEKALYQKFGNAWTDYLQSTKFLIPLVW
jgi:protein-S-isoprenylcysteine O-methyltransferase Ste14